MVSGASAMSAVSASASASASASVSVGIGVGVGIVVAFSDVGVRDVNISIVSTAPDVVFSDDGISSVGDVSVGVVGTAFGVVDVTISIGGVSGVGDVGVGVVSTDLSAE
jgi:hypothetical protein